MTYLHECVQTSNDINKLRELLVAGEDLNIRNHKGYTPLHCVVSKTVRKPRDMENILLFARELIRFGADVNLGDYRGRTPLHTVVIARRCELIEMLLEANADIDQKDALGMAALHFATSTGPFRRCEATGIGTELGVVELLLRYRPDIDIEDLNGSTPLTLAVLNNNFPIVQELLKNNASVNLRNSNGIYVVYCALNGPRVNANIVSELVKHGGTFDVSELTNYYIHKLMVAPANVEEMQSVFKLLVFDSIYWKRNQLSTIFERSKAENPEMSQFLESCANELAEMQLDAITKQYSVFDVAVSSIYCRARENRIASEITDKVIGKLIKGGYPLYRHLMLWGISTPYLKKKFVEICRNIEESGKKIFNSDVLRSLSFYLSEFDMLNMMIAFFGGKNF